MVVASGSDEPSLASARRVMGVIKRTIFNSDAIKNLINTYSASQKIAGTKEERVVRYTDSFHLSFVKTKSESLDPDGAPVFVLTARPFDRAEHTAALRKVLAPTHRFYFDDKTGAYLEINQTHVSCALCKQTTHPAHACVFAAVEGWTGTKPDARPGNIGSPAKNRDSGKKRPQGRWGVAARFKEGAQVEVRSFFSSPYHA